MQNNNNIIENTFRYISVTFYSYNTLYCFFLNNRQCHKAALQTQNVDSDSS